MLKLENIALAIKKTAILDGVSLELKEGEIVSLLGPSGSGKTSLLRTVMGLSAASSGRVLLDEQELCSGGSNRVPPEKRPFAFLFQDFTLFPHMSVEENILIGIKDQSADIKAGRLQDLARLLNIGPLLKRRIHSLSGGEQQRIALARTLAIKPRILLLDEPFSNLDKMTKTGLYHEVRSILREEGIAAILATHDQEEAFYFSDRLVVMSEGRVMADAPPQEVYDSPKSAWLARFVGEAHVLGDAQVRDYFSNGSEFASEAGTLLIRPEHISLESGEGWTVTDCEYYGVTTRYLLERSAGEGLSAVALGSPSYEAGQQVRLTLNQSPIYLRA